MPSTIAVVQVLYPVGRVGVDTGLTDSVRMVQSPYGTCKNIYARRQEIAGVYPQGQNRRWCYETWKLGSILPPNMRTEPPVTNVAVVAMNLALSQSISRCRQNLAANWIFIKRQQPKQIPERPFFRQSIAKFPGPVLAILKAGVDPRTMVIDRHTAEEVGLKCQSIIQRQIVLC